MILLADSGSTKTEWYLLDKNGSRQVIMTEGYNPYFVDTAYIQNSLRSNYQDPALNNEITQVFFYGSGCFPDKAPVIRKAVSAVFPNADVFIDLDLLAAARALLGTKSGFAAILGTGTNSCLYDGREIIQNIDSLGFILGDEGSGTHIGKTILSEFIRGYIPPELEQLFLQEYNLTKAEIFQRVYDQPFPNRFCSQFTRFASQNISQPYMNKLVEDCFRLLFKNLISGYDNYADYSFNCVGSVGHVFQAQLKTVAREFGMLPGIIVQSPAEGLIAYHLENLS